MLQPLQCNNNGCLIEAEKTYRTTPDKPHWRSKGGLLLHNFILMTVLLWRVTPLIPCRHLMMKAHCLQAVLSCQPWKALAVVTM